MKRWLVLSILACGCVFGQAGPPINWPGSLDTTTTLTQASNFVQTSLVNGISSNATTAIVNQSANIIPGLVLQIDGEQVQVSSIAGNTITFTRGYDSTSKTPHAKNAAVNGYWGLTAGPAAAHNVLVSAVLALEQSPFKVLSIPPSGACFPDGSWAMYLNSANNTTTLFFCSGLTWTTFSGGGGGGGGSSSFPSITSGTNTTAQMIVGTGSALTPSGLGVISANQINGLAPSPSSTTDTTNAANISSGLLSVSRLPAFTGDTTTSAGSSVTTTSKVNGTTVPASPLADQFLGTTASATGAWASVPSCVDAGGNHLNYNTSTHLFACGTSGGTAGSAAFNTITAGTNTSAAMLVGTGSSLAPTGAGTISANLIGGVAPATSATTDTTNASNISSGTVGAARLPAFTGDTTTSAGSTVTTTAKVNGTTVPVNSAADQALISSASATGFWSTIPVCLDAAGQHINYNTATHLFFCGTSGGTAGSAAFNTLTSGTNASAAMVVGTGSSLGRSGSGSIDASLILGLAPAASATTDATNATNIVAGTLTAARLPAFTGDTTTSAGSSVTTTSKVHGTTVPVNSAADQFLGTTASATGAWAPIPNCSDSLGQHLNYVTSTHSFVCGTTGGGGGGSVNFANAITPSGTINGSNTAFTLANVVNPPASLTLYRNGLLQLSAVDFTLSGAAITFLAGAVPQAGDSLVAYYQF